MSTKDLNKPLYVPKSWSIHFHFQYASVNHFANMYGFKTEEAALYVAQRIKDIDSVYIKCTWKNSKFGRWGSEEKQVKPL